VKTGRVLGLIPAKGGSVRVARKNLRLLGGKPLLQWAIESARGAGCLDRIVVSTEDAEAAEVARACGADVPFTRPDHLARDPYGVVEVCLHALEALEGQGDSFSHLVILLPTSPFRRAQHIREALDRFRAAGADFLMSVTQLDTALLAAHVAGGQFMEPLHPEWIGRLGARSKKEELPILVKANGAVVVADVKRLRAEHNYYVYPLAYYVMPSPAALDIDTEEDLKYAEFLLESGQAPQAVA
jgi:CMP-N,N'-diacetyllegionaminic acid synthase